ncbi:hypothetical protein AALP_AA1G050900 [Arabis alpina]|uniref:Bromo domain-containing protein n=1 Tax=Arabis alpina TaxID=50452 RepID=A0A087HL80_ARAAL|nr:hypothetical protein AALP_AA1G050900 [Arabis alpina]
MLNEQEEANGMNNVDNDNNIIYSTSDDDSDNNRIGEEDCNQVWGTWEELLLTCAVKRHGFKDWDSVSKEVISRSSLNTSAGNCRIKYQDLKQRFDSGNNESTTAEAAEEEITWLEKLRSLRVEELRRDVQRCDDSILYGGVSISPPLDLIKKLEEEKNEDDDDGDDKKPDLEVHDETKPVRLNRETTDSNRENRSMNESNSTGSDHDKTVTDPDPVNTVSRRSEMSNSGELGESGTSIGYGKRKRTKYRSGEDSGDHGGSGGDVNVKSAGDKSQPLIDIIKLIRSHPRGSVFESRLRSQENKDYKSLIRQHLDIKTIEKKLKKGSYVSSSLSFYRDLKLLFTNAIVFFPISSSESTAAHELRTIISNEMKNQTGKSDHSIIKAEAESSVSRLKSSVLPLVACKKKSSVSKKTSPSSSLKQKDEKKSEEVSEEKTVTTTTTTSNVAARSSRRTSNVVAKDTKTGRGKNSNNNKKQTDSKTESSNDDEDKEEVPKTEKKIASDKKKSVADFLKRIKKNSPQKAKEATSKDQKTKKSEGNVKKEAKPRELRSNSTGKKKAEVENTSKRKQPKKEAEEVTAATGKRGRESGKEVKQQPKKRSRR